MIADDAPRPLHIGCLSTQVTVVLAVRRMFFVRYDTKAVEQLSISVADVTGSGRCCYRGGYRHVEIASERLTKLSERCFCALLLPRPLLPAWTVGADALPCVVPWNRVDGVGEVGEDERTATRRGGWEAEQLLLCEAGWRRHIERP